MKVTKKGEHPVYGFIRRNEHTLYVPMVIYDLIYAFFDLNYYFKIENINWEDVIPSCCAI